MQSIKKRTKLTGDVGTGSSCMIIHITFSFLEILFYCGKYT